MISYGTYKLLHLLFLLTFFFSLGFAASEAPLFSTRFGKIVMGVISLFIFVAGMGLIARMGFKHGEGFPLWVYLKMGAWALINVFTFMIIKLKKPKQKVLMSLLLLFTGWGALWVVLNKPL
jgi:hypothetical protein